ncbi:MAG: catalase [Candidatus Nanopelagicales bacterium]
MAKSRAKLPKTPGAPSSAPPSLAEPTTPVDPLAPKPDQRQAGALSPTGVPHSGDPADRAQQGRYLTTSTGTRLSDTDHSLKAGTRGPTLLQDHHLREKITHFDHERIPERVVHARGAAAHGVFVANGAATGICRAAFLREGAETEVFVRISTVLGSRGSADTVRDTRGFATKFYTSEGNFDLVGNNMPVFFIQDGIKFPDVIHAAKPHPDREIPQAQSAHDTFWDFVSLHTEAQHHTIWNMSDRGIPRSLRMMEGFGIHTFRLVNDEGQTSLVKFHWKPRLGVHSLTWEEAQIINGTDPDYHRRDLADAIEAGAFPQFDLGVQVFPDTADEMFEGIDLLDPTKLVPEELAEVRLIGTMTLNANPANYFTETEQVAFHVGHLVPGIDVTNDPLLQVRLFSYIDTQITRLGGPNFNQLPINRPHTEVNDMLRDGMHQTADHTGVAPYRPNSLDGGCPFPAGAAAGAFIDVPVKVIEAVKQRGNPASFDDHFSQAGLFYRSLTPVERDHVAAAYTFELSRCYEETIRERQLSCLARIDGDLAAAVASGLGLKAPKAPAADHAREGSAPVSASAALSQLGGTWPVAGRQVGVVAGVDVPAAQLGGMLQALTAAGVTGVLIAPAGGKLAGFPVQRTYANVSSAELDALIVAGPTPPAPDAVPTLDAKAGAPADPATDPRVAKMLGEVWRHAKPLGVLGATDLAGIPAEGGGVVKGEAAAVVAGVLELLAAHRVWERFTPVSR